MPEYQELEHNQYRDIGIKITFNNYDSTALEYLKQCNKSLFDLPMLLVDNWLHYFISYGPKLLIPIIEDFKTIIDEDMPENYHDDVIKLFNGYKDNWIFNQKTQRFKIIDPNDSTTKEFNNELAIRLNLGITLAEVDTMEGIEFEKFLCKIFTKKGYIVNLTKASQDQGADLILIKEEEEEERIAVQAKRYSEKISNGAIQEVVAAKAFYNCSKAIVITNSYFTKSAMELAKYNKVILYNRNELLNLIKEYYDVKIL